MPHTPPSQPPGERDGVLGFTLLEVMVAIAILGLSLTVILSAQVGLFASGTYSQHLSEALPLARCRMTELEEDFFKLGFPEVDTNDEGACCVGDLRQDMRCAWQIQRIELPNPPPFDPNADGGANPAGSAGLSLGSGAPGGNLGPLGMLAGASNTLPGAGGPELGAGLAGIPGMTGPLSGGGTGALSGVLAAGASGGTGALAPMVMGIVYPSLKPMLEASIRKVTVQVLWREGMAKREIEIIQWVTNPVKGGFLPGTMGSDSAGFPMGGGAPLGGGPAPLGGGSPLGGGRR
jgi:general secretion pathway protein I